VELFLLLGVLAGSGLALLAGMAIARRAMAPIASLTSTAAEIARTRDPSRGIPQPEADDEVAELARTLEGMLRELDAARGETEAMLVRQRQFVADASHELRTPLTSVLANLELLAESLHGEQGEAAQRSALRSSQRMRRLVADLLLLARTDAARPVRTSLATSRRSSSRPPASWAGQHRTRDIARRRAGGIDSRDGRPRRSAPPDDQPARERPAPHSGRHRDPRLDEDHRRRPGRAGRRGRRSGHPRSSPRRCSSASCAAPATAAAPSDWGSRSCTR
jgi:HAMP domain-containing protein